MKSRFALLVIASVATFPTLGTGQERGSPFFPLKVGSKWHYRAGKDQKVVVRAVKAEEFTIMVDKGKEQKITGMLLEVLSGGRALTEHVAVLPDGVYRFTAAGKDINPPLRFLKFPPKKGETWQVESMSAEAAVKGTFTAGEADIAVPAGKFKTVTSSCQELQIGTQKMTVEYFFAIGVGIVKQRVHLGSHNVLLELEKYEP